MLLTPSLFSPIESIIKNAQSNAVRAVDNARVLMYWQIGKIIFEEEQEGKERAELWQISY